MSTLDPILEKVLEKDKQQLGSTLLPIVTVSASLKEDLKELYKLPHDDTLPDIVFSRAHYSMTLAILMSVWNGTIDQRKAWAVDPTNYVPSAEWARVEMTETIGKAIARRPLLKTVKDFIDRFGRNNLPILKSITGPLLFVTADVRRTILSMHIAAGNILVGAHKQIVQVITDPHVRYDYLLHAENPLIRYCVFDEATRVEFLEKAAIDGKKIDPEHVIVTGPPIDPRIIATRHAKHAWSKGPLKLCITTGGLGTNKDEIETVLTQLLPELRKHPSPYKLLIYAGTHRDIYDMVVQLAKEHRVKIGKITDRHADLRILYHAQIVNANELLIKYGFPWADGFISKPSGDMAYDAVAAGCFLLTLKEWGEWEENIRHRFEEKGISRRAETKHIVPQLEALRMSDGRLPWIESAMIAALNIEKYDPYFLDGAKNITAVVHAFEKSAEN